MDEVEIKYRLGGSEEHERLRTALRGLGAVGEAVQQESNRLYDTEARDLRERGAVLRVRQVGDATGGKLTYKGPARYRGVVKAREELELAVGDAGTMRALLEALGYRESVAYAKEREAWRLGDVEVVLDTLPFGHFCEIEGPEEAILALAVRLGLTDDQVEPRGYPSLAALAAGQG